MKTSIQILLIGFLALSFNYGKAQDCSQISFTKGASYEMENYDAKDKKTGMVKSTVKDVTSSGSKKEATVHSEMYNKKNEKEHEGDLKFICEGGKILIDISNLLSSGSMAAATKDMEMKMEGSSLEIPASLTVGQALPQGTATMKMLDKKTGDLFSTTNIAILNRKVESKESVTTPAGTFETYKISYEIKTETSAMGMKLPGSTSKGVEFYSTSLGISVKTQTLDKKGDMVGYSVLSKYTK